MGYSVEQLKEAIQRHRVLLENELVDKVVALQDRREERFLRFQEAESSDAASASSPVACRQFSSPLEVTPDRKKGEDPKDPKHREGSSINKSLLQLGIVINMLAECPTSCSLSALQRACQRAVRRANHFSNVYVFPSARSATRGK